MKVVILGGFGAQQTVFVEGIENQWLQNVLSKLLGLTLTTVFPKEKSLIKTPSWASQLPVLPDTFFSNIGAGERSQSSLSNLVIHPLNLPTLLRGQIC